MRLEYSIVKVCSENTVRRWLIGTVVVIFVFILSLPFVFGVITKHQFTDFVSNMSSPNVEVSLKDYRLGWFSSSAKTQIAINREENSDSTNSFTVLSNIKHGPFFWVNKKLQLGRAFIENEVVISPELKSTIESVFNQISQQPKILQQVVLDLTGDMQFNFSVSPFVAIDPTVKSQFNWQGLNASLFLSKELVARKFDFDFNGMLGNSADAQVEIGKIVIRDKGQYTTNKDMQIESSDSYLRLPKLQIRMKDGTDKFLLKDVELSFVTKLENISTLLSAIGRISFTKLIIEGEQYGPCLLSFVINHIDSVTLSKLNKLVAMHNNQPQILAEKIRALFPLLINKGLEIKINKFDCSIPEGGIKAQANVILPKQDDKTDLLQLVNNAKMTIDLQISAKLLKNLLTFIYIKEKQTSPQQENSEDSDLFALAQQNSEKQIKFWLEQGWLQAKEKDTYHLMLSYSPQGLLVNQKPVFKRLPSN